MSSDKATLFLEGEGDVNLRHLNSTFAKETKRSDGENAMKEYIDREVARRQGYLEDYDKRQKPNTMQQKLEDRDLYKLPEEYRHIPITYAPHNQGEIGFQILEGIPEIDLGTDKRIEMMEKTIKTREKLARMEESERTKIITVPSNYTANYLLHNRFRGEDYEVSDTARYIDVKEDLSQYSGAKYDVCNDNNTR